MGWIGGIKPIEVEIYQAGLGSITELVTASGEIQPEVEVRVSPEVPGEIIELNIMEGDFVDEGKLLVKIRPDNFINALERAKANYNQVRANLSSSKSNLSFDWVPLKNYFSKLFIFSITRPYLEIWTSRKNFRI